MKPWFAAVCLVASLLPAGETRPLFTIERSLNHNVLHYEANLAADGTMDPKEPIVAYWVMLEKGACVPQRLGVFTPKIKDSMLFST